MFHNGNAGTRISTTNVHFLHKNDDPIPVTAFSLRPRLSPGFDLTFCNGMNNAHTTAIAGQGNPRKEHLLKIAKKFHLHRAEQIIEEVRHAVSMWPTLATQWGVRKTSLATIQAELSAIDKRL